MLVFCVDVESVRKQKIEELVMSSQIQIKEYTTQIVVIKRRIFINSFLKHKYGVYTWDLSVF